MNFYKLILVISLLFVCQQALAEKVYVVVHNNNNQDITPDLVKQIYSDKVSFWKNGETILVFELPVTSNAREKFAYDVLSKSSISSQRDWSNRFVNNTIKNQVKVKPQRLVARFVAKKENAIGYISETQLQSTQNVRVVMVIE
ncbi:hypothetical protein ACOI22_15855 [Glaciecola sp. 2405UD65-10]|uniref:hypothetical protein n=1 Tax=Glaciecola sp. 2405UD65-10 TaxID=3397244 RepID=UPI003B5C7247